MPFAGPETALASTIDAETEESFAPDKTARPVGWKDLVRIINHFHQDSTT